MNICPAQNKIIYATKPGALRSLLGMLRDRTKRERRPGERLRVYRCPSCHWWHIGHVARWKTAKRTLDQQGVATA